MEATENSGKQAGGDEEMAPIDDEVVVDTSVVLGAPKLLQRLVEVRFGARKPPENGLFESLIL